MKLRTGDYVVLFDEATNEVFVQTKSGEYIFEKNFPMIGGGREKDEDYKKCLVREVREETEGKVILEIEKVTKICEFDFLEKFESGGKSYDGKSINIYIYKYNKSDLESFDYYGESGYSQFFEWIPVERYLKNSRQVIGDSFARFMRDKL